MSKPTITLAMLAELVEASKAVYVAGRDTTPEQHSRLLHAIAPLDWRVAELQRAVPVVVA